MRIGIIGSGFVGSAIGWAHRGDELVIRDPKLKDSASLDQFNNCDAIYICVPSPPTEDGHCDPSILENVLKELLFVNINKQIPFISKVTAPPSVYERLGKEYPNLVHCPEFLTAAHAAQDYANTTWTIIGGEVRAWRHEAERVIKLTQSNLKTVKFCNIGEAALAKYAVNSFLATKVVFMNELYQIANKAGLNYDIVANLAKQDDRIGYSHMNVPGSDGVLGFGGKCFPKDTGTLLKYAEGLGITPMVLDAAVKKNTFLRLTEPK
jgi:UDPglucose 6-dehydrogenase